jgi:photosystem II stability/assembly factor-like uncharacterized protein
MKKFYKIFTLSLFSFLIVNCTLKIDICYSQWTLQTNPLSSSANMCKIQFVSPTEGWISVANNIPNSNALLHTTNAGNSWIVVSPFLNDSLGGPVGDIGLCFINSSTGWVINTLNTQANRYGAVIFKTINGGVNWQRNVVSQNTGDGGYQIQFNDASNGWVSIFSSAGSNLNQNILKSTNGGNNWTLISSFSLKFGLFYFVDNNTGWMSRLSVNNGIPQPPFEILKSTNGGANWTIQYSDNNPVFSMNTAYLNIRFTDQNNGWAVGANSRILKTTNGGTNWVLINNAGIGTTAGCRGIFFLNNNSGWIGIDLDTITSRILYTSNGGNNWTLQSAPGRAESIVFINATTGWFAGTSHIAYTTNGGVWIKQITSEVPSGYTLKQNYPNPFNPTTNIKFDIPENGKWKMENNIVSLKIYDILGKEMETLVNEKLKPGTYDVIWDASQYPSGVYFYRLITDGFSETKKMILVK